MKFVPCWNMDIVGISLLYLVYFNAPMYLVKGGRLGLMFLNFAFLARLGVMGTSPGHLRPGPVGPHRPGPKIQGLGPMGLPWAGLGPEF